MDNKTRNSDTEQDINGNILIYGGSDSDKAKLIESKLLKTDSSSLVVPAPKRRFINQYRPVFSGRQYQTAEINFASPGSGNSTHGYDPLQHIRSYPDIRFLAELLMAEAVPVHTKAGTSYCGINEMAAISLHCAEISYILATIDHASYADVIAFHEQMLMEDDGRLLSFENRIQNLPGTPAQEHLASFAKNCWYTYSLLPRKQASRVLSLLNRAIETFDPDFREMIAGSKKPFDFKKLGSRKTILFVTVPVKPAAYTRMFYGMLFKETSGNSEKQPGPVPVEILYDFNTGGPILYLPEFMHALDSIMLFTQSEKQLEEFYGFSGAEQILSCCDTHIHL
ncbi:MAG: type IV secretory system conjugative DNA transfer family protein [Lachnospiraceae bacterium]|nr:type IV secretory system conjugative DNA transfer family protein [Lachnospiraceae bacterium]